ncbi:GNAT family N-acetyltransferase [Oleiharenicola lentus]|nr:GNAT family N-acetyltransferase [Oleiharenicola lentus]
MNVRFTSIEEFSPARTAELLTQAFADYFVKIPFTETGLRQMELSDSVDLARSPVMWLDGNPVGAALIARRGATSRLAGMALVPAARGRGAGRALMEQLFTAARNRGDQRLVLEVIEQNTAAVKLYEAVGFARIRRLVGFAGSSPAGLAAEPALVEAELREVAAAVTRLDDEVGWPWQISGPTLAQLAAPAKGYTLDGAWAVVLNPAGPVVGLRALAVDGKTDRERRAVRILRALMARHPAVTGWRMSALWPEEWATWFTGAGFARQELTQWQMAREL